MSVRVIRRSLYREGVLLELLGLGKAAVWSSAVGFCSFIGQIGSTVTWTVLAEGDRRRLQGERSQLYSPFTMHTRSSELVFKASTEQDV